MLNWIANLIYHICFGLKGQGENNAISKEQISGIIAGVNEMYASGNSDKINNLKQ